MLHRILIKGVGIMKHWMAIFAFLALFGLTLPTHSEAVVLSETCSDIEDPIELGRCLFQKETFNGNGRTCATCHPDNNNFTIDPKFIATLPADNELFVFEDEANFPGLTRCQDVETGDFGNECKLQDVGKNGPPGCKQDEQCRSLENGVLLRKFGLVR